MSKHVIVTPPEIYTTYILSVLSKRKEDPQTIFDNLTKVWCAVPTLKLKNL